MAVDAPEPRTGSMFILLITVLLFLSMVAGGGCLIIYIIQPESPFKSWLPIVGVGLICIPWVFWLVTCSYRCLSRRFGRGGGGGGAGEGGAREAGNVVGAGGGGAREGGNVVGGAAGAPSAANVNAGGDDVAIEDGNLESLVRSPENDARRRAQFEAILALDDNDGEELENKDEKKRRSSSSTSSNDKSVISHESELPLASSMAA
jgi:hypothetical protein